LTEKLLIVGGTGFIGKNLASEALNNGFITSVLSLNEPQDKDKIDGVDYIQADIVNNIQLKDKLSTHRFDYIVNLSGYIDHSDFFDGGEHIINTHFLGLVNLLQIIDRTNLKRFLQIGSSDEYGSLKAPQNEEMRESPFSAYSLGKVASTHLLQMLYKTENYPVGILRLFLVYGAGQDYKRFIPQVIRACLFGSQFPVSLGEQIRDFCFIDDITRGILLALKNDNVTGEVINLASGIPISIREVVEKIQAIVGQGKPKFGEIPYRVGENMVLYADTKKTKKYLSWEPEISIEEGLMKTIEYYQCNI